MEPALEQRARAARERIAGGALRGDALFALLEQVPAADRDPFVDAMLGIEDPPPDVALPRGAVPYLPCGVAQILAMVRAVPLREHDVLVDLGAGLGRVLFLAHLLSGARGHGIEVQAHLVERARACASGLGLTSVSFEHANALDAELEGSVFFLYAPFNGVMLERVVQRLDALASTRPIVVCTVDVELDPPSLVRRATRDGVTVYDAADGARSRSDGKDVQ